MSGYPYLHVLLTIIVRDEAPILEGLAHFSWMHRSMVWRLSNVLRLSTGLFSTFNWPRAEGAEIEPATDRDPPHRLSISDENFVFFDLHRLLALRTNSRRMSTHVNLFVGVSNDCTFFKDTACLANHYHKL